MAGDFTGDGRLDLATANFGSYPHPAQCPCCLGNGDGTFQPQVTYAVGSWPDAIVAGDFTGDGRTDLAVANSADATVSVLLGKGDGTFQSQVTYAVGLYPVAIVAGNFASDGRIDLAVATLVGDVSVLLGNGDGTFQPQVAYAVASIVPTAIAAGDFTGDGHLDLAVAGWLPFSTEAGEVSVLLGQRGWYLPAAVQSAERGRVLPGRHRGGGFHRRRPDRPGSRQHRGQHGIRASRATATARSSPRSPMRSGRSRMSIVAGDFNGDGRTDLAVANLYSNDVSILLGNGDGTFQPQVTYAVGRGPDSIVAGDFTGDGHLDLAVANSQDNTVSVLLGNGDGTFQPQVTYAVGSYPASIVAGNFNGDGQLDLAVVNLNSDDVSRAAGQRRRYVRAPGHLRGRVGATSHRGGGLHR